MDESFVLHVTSTQEDPDAYVDASADIHIPLQTPCQPQ